MASGILVWPEVNELSLKGRLRRLEIEGGVYVLEAIDGRRYDVHGLDRITRERVDSAPEGIEAKMRAVLRVDLMDVHMVGPILQVLEVELAPKE